MDDPEGAALLTECQDVLERALAAGREDVASRAAATLANLHAKEAEVRRTQEVSSEAQDRGLRTIMEVGRVRGALAHGRSAGLPLARSSGPVSYTHLTLPTTPYV